VIAARLSARFDASRWGWAAVLAAAISGAGFLLQSILDYVPAPSGFKFAEFWGLFAADAVIGFLAGVVAVLLAWRTKRRDATLAFGLIGVGWLLLVQGILLVWD
jgi:hypothetical protein